MPATQGPRLALWNRERAPVTLVHMSQTVLIVDDHDTYRAFVKSLLQEGGFEVVGEAANALSGLDAIRSLQPDLVVLDVQLPSSSGFEMARQLRSEGFSAPIILMSSREAASYGDQIDNSGAVGFIPKGEMSGETVRAVLEAPRNQA